MLLQYDHGADGADIKLYGTICQQVPSLIKSIRKQLIKNLETSEEIANKMVTFTEELYYLMPQTVEQTVPELENAIYWTRIPDTATPVELYQLRGREYQFIYEADYSHIRVSLSISDIFSDDDLLKYVRGIYINDKVFSKPSKILTYVGEDISHAKHLDTRKSDGTVGAWNCGYYTNLISALQAIYNMADGFKRSKTYEKFIARVIIDIVNGDYPDNVISRLMAVLMNYVKFAVYTTKKHIDKIDTICYLEGAQTTPFGLLTEYLLVDNVKLTFVDWGAVCRSSTLLSDTNRVTINLTELNKSPWERGSIDAARNRDAYNKIMYGFYYNIIDDIMERAYYEIEPEDAPRTGLRLAPRYSRWGEDVPEPKKTTKTKKPSAPKKSTIKINANGADLIQMDSPNPIEEAPALTSTAEESVENTPIAIPSTPDTPIPGVGAPID